MLSLEFPCGKESILTSACTFLLVHGILSRRKKPGGSTSRCACPIRFSGTESYVQAWGIMDSHDNVPKIDSKFKVNKSRKDMIPSFLADSREPVI